MSTSETDEYDVGTCPCGHGKIVKRVTTQDNPWSSADISHRVECGSCASEWRVERSYLVKSSSEREYRLAEIQERQAYRTLVSVMAPLVNGYFEVFGPKTKKAQHGEMLRLGISKESYRGYLNQRKNAKSIAETCYPLGNREWLHKLSIAAGTSKEFVCAADCHEIAKHAKATAYDRIVRWPIAR